jgi:internalin A
MKKLLFLTIGLTFLVQATLVSTASAQPKSFAQWCQQKSSVPAATRHTIDVLLKKAGTNNCQAADSKLRSLTELNLYSSH